MAKGHRSWALAGVALMALVSPVPAHAQEQSKAEDVGRSGGELSAKTINFNENVHDVSASVSARWLARGS